MHFYNLRLLIILKKRSYSIVFTFTLSMIKIKKCIIKINKKDTSKKR